MLKIAKNEDGQTMVTVALLIVIMMGFAAFAIDIGIVVLQKSNMQKAADAAALAGAQDLPTAVDAMSTAVIVAGRNDLKAITNGVLKDGDTVTTTTPYKDDPTKIEVECTRQVQFLFARVLGFKETSVTARAVALNKGSKTSVSGLRPWALVNQYKVTGGTAQNPTYTWLDYTYTYGLEFLLKAGGGGGSNGYYGIVGFGNQNANSGAIYKVNVEIGYDGIVKNDDYILDGSGNVNVNIINDLMIQSGDTTGDYTKATIGNSRVVLIPKIDAHTLKVIGFAAVYLKSVDNKGFITANFLYDTTWTEAQKELHEDWGLASDVELSE